MIGHYFIFKKCDYLCNKEVVSVLICTVENDCLSIFRIMSIITLKFNGS